VGLKTPKEILVAVAPFATARPTNQKALVKKGAFFMVKLRYTPVEELDFNTG